jgi:tetratricopeptide (TPR) repeat protein
MIVIIFSAAFVLGTCAGTYAQSDDPEALNKRAMELRWAGQYSAAVPLAERYAEAMKSRHGAEAPQYATALNNVAMLYRTLGRYAEAEPMYQRALAIDEKALGQDHKGSR